MTLYWIILFFCGLTARYPPRKAIGQWRHVLWYFHKKIGIIAGLKNNSCYYRKATAPPKDNVEFNQPPKPGRRFRKKPEWVLQKIIRLGALNPQASLRDIENIFNRSEALISGETVSHTYVSRILKTHAYQIKVLAKDIHNRRPKAVPHHLIWAADLTFLPDANETPQPILGIVEHASRACLTLTAIHNKTSVTLLRLLADVIEHLSQKPKILRTDNEAIFTSKAFRFGLWLSGIKHQTTEVASPWQNGKIERFFGILKQKSKGLVFNTLEELNHHLAPFRFWYNHIRPHGYLDYLTPFEAYHKKAITYAQPAQDSPLFFSAWNHRLTGFWFRRE